jgi:iron complex outermembrane recepter protein
MNTHRTSLLVLIPLLILASAPVTAEQDLTDLDLETLMGMDVAVTSATRREQASADAAAAVYVITREDIRRSGATSLPEVLRMAPGVQVARINTRAWAVSARGFNSRFANKLLVMVDGRSIYTPVFSGVLWEEQSVFLDEIERVEIVRGPGGALWGINAVNGVINIISRKAADADGLRVTAGAGPVEGGSASLSYGGDLEGVGDYRFYVDHNEIESLGASSAPWTHTQAGWRLDRPMAEGSFTFQGDINESDFGSVPEPPAASLPVTAQVGNVSASWRRNTAPGQFELRSYYGWAQRGVPGKWNESALGFDGEFAAERVGRHLLTTGVGYRHIVDEMEEPWPILTVSKTKVRQHQWSAYAQDEVHFFDDDVRLIVGAKLEDLESTGLEFQPTARTLWHVTDSHTLWTAASRAVRTPSRIELNSQTEFGGYMPNGQLIMFRVFGDEDLKAETLHAYELGWRWRPYQALSIDLALYRNEYEHLVETLAQAPEFDFGPPMRLVLPTTFANGEDVRMDGAELVTEWAANEWLRLEAQGTWQDSEVNDLSGTGSIDPKRMFMLRARVDLPRDIELDLAWRSISELPGRGVDSYQSLNARAAWRPIDSIELSLTMDNVLDEKHIESADELAIRPGAMLGRSYFARVTWQPWRERD